MIIGDRLKELRKDRKLTQGSLAEILGVKRTTISAWENETSAPFVRNGTPLSTKPVTSANLHSH